MLFRGQSKSHQSLNHHQNLLKFCHSKNKYMLSVSLSNQKCTTQPTIIHLTPNESTQGLQCYPFVVNLDICVGSCNTLNNLSNKVCVAKKKQKI